MNEFIGSHTVYFFSTIKVEFDFNMNTCNWKVLVHMNLYVQEDIYKNSNTLAYDMIFLLHYDYYMELRCINLIFFYNYKQFRYLFSLQLYPSKLKLQIDIS